MKQRERELGNEASESLKHVCRTVEIKKLINENNANQKRAG